MNNDFKIRELLRAAIMAQTQGHPAQAIAAYRELLQINPFLPDIWFNLGYQLRLAGMAQQALEAYKQALNHGVQRPEEIHLNRGAIFSEDLRRDDLAEAELQIALWKKKGFVPALFNLANIAENGGDRKTAADRYEQALALAPGHHEALARYANLLEQWPNPAITARLNEHLGQSSASFAEKASLGFALGNALDKSSEFGKAFEAYVEANKQSRKSLFEKQASYDGRSTEYLIDQLITVFSRNDQFGAEDDLDTSTPIFICGMFRSGSTLAEQVLSRHPRITAGGELEFLPNLTLSELAPFPSSMADITRNKLESLSAHYQQKIMSLFPGADLVTDKRPENFLYIGLIKALLPRAKFIHTVRRPLDNFLSIYFLHLDQRYAYALDLKDIVHYYRQYRRLMNHWKKLFSGDIFDFDYDRYVQNPRHETGQLLHFCGLEWSEDCMSFQANQNTIRTASAWQVRQPLHSRSSGRWRNYEKELRALKSVPQDFWPEQASAGPR